MSEPGAITPPRHYIPNLSRRRYEETHPLEELDRNIPSRVPTIPRRSSNRIDQNDGRITKPTRGSKKRRPGLSIDTTVTRHSAKQPPRELNSAEVRNAEAARVVQPWQATESIVNAAAKNSPSKFPTTYLDASKRQTMRFSPGHQDLYFAPPPPTRRTSSVYSRGTRCLSVKDDISGRQSMKTKVFIPSASRPTSTTPSFDPDNYLPNRQRYTSGGTVFEEDGISAPIPDTAYTITPHRSRGWWNVITTPFESRPGTAIEFRSSSEGEKTPAVPSIPTHFVNPLSSPQRQALARNKSAASALTNSFSPEDREVPIMFDSRSSATFNQNLAPGRPRNSSQSTTGSTLNRMPLADVGKSPASGNTEFSPAGMITAEGNVGGSTTIVNVVVPEHLRQREQTVEILSVPQAEQPHTQRYSFRQAVSRTVRYIPPQSSESAAPAQTTNLELVPPTPKSVRFLSRSYDQEFSPPHHHSRSTSGDYFEEFEIDDKPSMENKRDSFWIRLSNKHKNKKLEKQRNKALDKHPGKKEKKKMSKRRKCCICCLCLFLTFLVIVVLIIVLAVMLSKKHKGSTTVVYTNITNFPGIPNGPLTIARPNLVASQQACVNPLTMWSCAVPKEQQASISPNAPNQPNFVLDVFYDNSTNSNPITTKRSASGTALAGYLGQVSKRSTFTPFPGPPSMDDYTFLGKTTDNITAPVQGESTPFYISMVNPGDSAPKQPTKVKRSPQSSQTVNSIPDPASAIPVPSLNPDGTPPPANLLPLPSYQPVRFFNRGLPTEHYGFYTYFDRNIFLRSNTVQSSTLYIPADDNGGSAQVGANVRCTWQQTRYFVQIWTNNHDAKLLPKASSGSKIANGDFQAPGSFPYPVTITLDRHGGDPTVKALYCYELDVSGKLLVDQKKFQVENRTFDGTIVNPATGPFSNASDVSIANGGPGGIDGGTGGCYCKWQNFS